LKRARSGNRLVAKLVLTDERWTKMQMAPRIIGQAAAIVAVSALVAVATNAVRPDGIPLITDVEYEIFAPCKDSEAQSDEISGEDLAAGDGGAVYVDARPAEAFAVEHVLDAVNVPYSVLFGAAQEDLDRLDGALASRKAGSVIVYGVLDDPSDPSSKVDLAKQLARQLVEAGVAGVRHVEGGLEELKKSGIRTVKATGGEK
jgi:rhodanese-related sulfurtransferase